MKKTIWRSVAILCLCFCACTGTSYGQSWFYGGTGGAITIPSSFSFPITLNALPTPVNGTFTDITTGGSLLNSTAYYYVISATNSIGETLASTETSLTTSGVGANAHKITVTATGFSNATGCDIYGRTTAAESFIAAGSITGNTCSYTDTGSITPSITLYPASSNSTAGLAMSGATGGAESISLKPFGGAGTVLVDKSGDPTKTSILQLKSDWDAISLFSAGSTAAGFYPPLDIQANTSGIYDNFLDANLIDVDHATGTITVAVGHYSVGTGGGFVKLDTGSKTGLTSDGHNLYANVDSGYAFYLNYPETIWTSNGSITSPAYATGTNCSSAAGTCGSAAAGSVSIAAAASTVTVSTTAVTANSQIFIQEDSSLGTKLTLTCNTTIARTYAVTTRTASTSFVITSSAAPIANPACLTYFIVN